MKMQFDIPIPHSYRIDIEAGRVVEEGTVLATKMEDDANLKNRKRPLKDGVDERIQSNEKDSLAPKTIKKIRLPQKETGDGEIDIQSMPNTNVTNDASITIDRIRNNAEENISNDIVDIESVLKNTFVENQQPMPFAPENVNEIEERNNLLEENNLEMQPSTSQISNRLKRSFVEEGMREQLKKTKINLSKL